MNFNQSAGYQPLTTQQRFFARQGGSTLASLERSDPDDQQKRINAGKVVVIIAAVSGGLASWAWSIPMGPIGFMVGIPWFMIMLVLERSILQQMDVVAAQRLASQMLKGNFDPTSQKRSGVGFGWLLLRFTMIIGICYFNSEMIRVVMFKPEIVAEIKVRTNKETAKITDSLDVQKQAVKKKMTQYDSTVSSANQNLMDLVDNYNARINSISDSIAMLNAKLPYEVKGPGGISGKSGDGPVAKSIRESIGAFQNQRNELIALRDSATGGSAQAHALAFAKVQADSGRSRGVQDLAKLDKIQKDLIDEVMSRPVNGLAFMLEVLNDISGRNPIIWAVFFLFFFIEAIPVLLKFFSKNDTFIQQRAIQHLRSLKETNEEAEQLLTALEEIKNRRGTGS